MPVLITTILGWLVESTIARVLWASISWWFMTGLIPVIVGAINGAAGDPLSFVPAACWWGLDLIGFDIWLPAITSAYLIRFIIRRMPK